MPYKLALLFIALIIGVFFYLHIQNPFVVDFTVTEDYRYTLPVIYLIAAGFFAGMVLAVANSIVSDLRRVFREMKTKREAKLRETSRENYREGVVAFFRGNINRARALLEEALAANPGDTDITVRLAETYANENNFKEAAVVLEKGLAKAEGSIEILVNIAKYADRSGDAVRLEKTLKEILRTDPANMFAMRRQRDIRVENKDFAGAVELQRKLLGLERNSAWSSETSIGNERTLMSALLYEDASAKFKDNKFAQAAQGAKEAIATDDGFIPAHVLMGEIYLAEDNVSGAMRTWRSAYDRRRDPVLFLKIEDLYLKRSKPEKILEKYRRALFERPDDMYLRLLFARLFLRLEMIEEAIEELDGMGAVAEESFYYKVLLGEAYFRRNRTDRAAQHFRTALNVDRELFPYFTCILCNATFNNWRGRCPSCGRWNSFRMSVNPSEAVLVSQHKAEELRTFL
ncbi:MAG: tetratricopeptide repeat protein [Deltaproteobacteria bacterium]|nr:tetratricopeptide repeat protein [Deltaproteobacteria bacterium]